jgi:pimeloyl-ACP methyl ester carboxylesterase
MPKPSSQPLPRNRSGAQALPALPEKAPLHDVPPSAWLMALEVRAIWEFSALLPAWPLLNRAPRGDNHPVLVFPGLTANDISTAPLRRYLQLLNHSACGWDQGFNFGPRPGVLDEARDQVMRTCDSTGRKVSLIGWSLGGIYARELAKELPDMVRGVITMGTPFAGSHKSTNAWRLYELASGRSVAHEAASYNLPAAPPVPTTSIYSRSDGVVAWQGSIQTPSKANPQTENIEVVASHVGLGFNPSAWWAVADRLAQPEGEWKPFSREKRGRVLDLIYPDPNRAA